MVRVTAERIPDSQVRLSIEVEPERIEKSVDRAYRKYAGQVNIPGFRRGKAPRHIVERFVGKETLMQEGLEQLLGEVYREAIQQADIHPVDQPELDLEPKLGDLKPGESLVVKATVPVRPTVELGDYHSIRVPRVAVDVTPEEVNAIVEQIREQQAEWVPVERPVQEGDQVVIDVHGEVGTYARLYSSSGEPLLQSTGGKTIVHEEESPFLVEKETLRYPPGVVDQVIGMTAGQEKQFELSLPSDYPDPELANLLALFRVKVRDVKEKRVPAVDDELAKAVGYDNLEELREDLRKRALASAESRANESYERSIISELIAISKIEVPPAIVNREIDHQMDHAKESLRLQRIELDEYLRLTRRSEADLREGFREQAAHNVKSALVLEEVAEKEGIAVSPEEIDQDITAMSQILGDRAESLREAMSAPTQREAIAYRIRHRKVMDLLKEIAQSGEATQAEAAGDQAEVVASEASRLEAAEADAESATAEVGAAGAGAATTDQEKE